MLLKGAPVVVQTVDENDPEKVNPHPYRGTSLIRNTPLLGPYSRTIPRVVWWS